jgi:hypothetical protein
MKSRPGCLFVKKKKILTYKFNEVVSIEEEKKQCVQTITYSKTDDHEITYEQSLKRSQAPSFGGNTKEK